MLGLDHSHLTRIRIVNRLFALQISAFLITSHSFVVINFIRNITEAIFYKLETRKDS